MAGGRRARLAVGVAAVAALLLSLPAGGATRSYTTGSIQAAIPDGGQVEVGITVPDRGPVVYLAVGVRLDHARDADLSVSLVAPDGASVPLSTRRGGTGRNFGQGSRSCAGQLTVFEDTAPLRLADERPPFAGSYRPDGRLARLYGKEARGRWRLRVSNDDAGREGTLFCWKLDLARDIVELRAGRAGAVLAELRFRERNFTYRDVRLRIVRAGRVEYDRPLGRSGCGVCPYWRPVVDGRTPIAVRDLDRDREPEVVADFFTGGAHCCTYSLILRYARARAAYRSTRVDWGNVGYRLVDLGRDGRPEFSSADDRFNYAFAAYAASAPPIRILRFERGTLVNVTRRFGGAVAADAARLWRFYERTRRSSFPEVRGILAGYMADEYLIGGEERGWRRLELALRRGDLGRAPARDGYPAGRAYLTKLRRFLVTTGYAR